jgi:hypothetical protein
MRVSRRPPAASRLSRRTGNWPLLSTHHDRLDGPTPDERVPGDPIAVATAAGRAVRRPSRRTTRRSPTTKCDRRTADAYSRG